MKKKKNIIIALLVCLCVLICNLTFICVYAFADPSDVIPDETTHKYNFYAAIDQEPYGISIGHPFWGGFFNVVDFAKIDGYWADYIHTDENGNKWRQWFLFYISENRNDFDFKINAVGNHNRGGSSFSINDVKNMSNYYKESETVTPSMAKSFVLGGKTFYYYISTITSGIDTSFTNDFSRCEQNFNFRYFINNPNGDRDFESALLKAIKGEDLLDMEVDINGNISEKDENKEKYNVSLPVPSNVWGDYFDNSLPLRKPIVDATKFMLEPPDNTGSGFSGILRFYDEELQGKNYGLMLNIDVNLKTYYSVDVPGWYEALHPLTNFDKTEDITISYKVDLNNIDSVFRPDLNKYFFNFGNEKFPCDYDNAKSIFQFYKANAKEYIKKYETTLRRPFWNVNSVSISGFIYDDVNKCKSDSFTVAFTDFDKSGQSNKSSYSYKDSLGKDNTIGSDNTSGTIKDMTNKDGTLTDYAKDNNWSLEQELNKEENQQKVSFKSSLKDMREYAEMFIDYLKDMFIMLPYFVWSLLAFVIAFVAVARVLGR